ncbi:ABC transporter ATP-binding protein [Kribbella qitaiheensis]|uniref:ABC transporter ATP-binding protein n=1 Tax=Kribbella qitaiheensis TaxID=1544730 RepID=A0A7G6WU67_9ACTN|nr:ABC transporter ATP-binding protein [Kribbella qitaiheensis]QNE17532.1 ABC transporter ATP-binding protein [Kribbella qitaiheensis]
MHLLELSSGTKSVVGKSAGSSAGKPAADGHGGEQVLLRGVSLTLDPGERVAVVGRSGSGKSTLLSILGLLDDLSDGTYLVDGVGVRGLRDAARARLRAQLFGFVFQNFCLLPQLSVRENVEAAILHLGLRRRSRRELALEALAKVRMEGLAGRRPDQLSGGERQRVAIARALVCGPRVILADEPTGSLDEETGAVVMKELHALAHDGGVALVVVTHDKLVAAGCDRMLTLDRGALVSP